jgi:hypothetical protein
MNIYIINPKKDFPAQQLSRLSSLKNVYFIDNISELDKTPPPKTFTLTKKKS